MKKSEVKMYSPLYQNLAHDIFGDVGGVFFCTDTE